MSVFLLVLVTLLVIGGYVEWRLWLLGRKHDRIHRAILGIRRGIEKGSTWK